jgi:hypothetical protein
VQAVARWRGYGYGYEPMNNEAGRACCLALQVHRRAVNIPLPTRHAGTGALRASLLLLACLLYFLYCILYFL